MNKTTKVALCISLVGIGVFAWPHFAAAGKPAAPVWLTFGPGGDVVSAAPQEVSRSANTQDYISAGPFTATIDFDGYRPCPEHSPAGGQAVLDFLQGVQEANGGSITYDSLTVSVSKSGPLYSRLDFETKIDGVPYYITMNVFLSGTIESTLTLNTVHCWEGRFAVMSKTKGFNLLVVAGPDRQADVEFTVTK